MSTLLFVEILRERDVQAQWFDVRKVMRTNDRFGRAEPDVAALAELAALQLLPRLNEGLVITRDLSAAKIRSYNDAWPWRQRLYGSLAGGGFTRISC